MKTERLWRHQLDALEKSRGRSNLALFMEPGTGKTRAVIEILRDRYNRDRKIIPTLILAPLVVCRQFKNEIHRFSQILEQDVLCLDQASTRKRSLDKFVSKNGGRGIIITNYEAILNEDVYKILLLWAKILVLDESHRCKNYQSKRFKKLVPIADRVRECFILTGTPVLNSPMDIFAQYRLLDKGAAFGHNFFAFRAKYFYDKNASMPKHIYFPNWVVRPSGLQEISRILDATSVQAKKSECVDLPPLVLKKVMVSLGEDQRRAYESMARSYIAIVQESAITAQIALVKSLRLQQILAGFVQTEEGDVHFFEDVPRWEALSQLLEDSCQVGQTILWANFRALYSRMGELCEKVGLSYAFLTGEQSNSEKMESVARFSRQDVQILIANPGAGGVGINLTSADKAIYYTRDWSLEKKIQSEARNYRGGSHVHEKVTHYHLVSADTIDERIFEALDKKEDIGKILLDWK